MERPRLSSVLPDLDDALAAIPTSQQRYAAWAAARWAMERVGLSHAVVNEAVATGDVGLVGNVVAEYDDRYYELQTLNEIGQCTVEEMQKTFSLARAASAVEFAARGYFADAIYESGIAVDDWLGLCRALEPFLD